MKVARSSVITLIPHSDPEKRNIVHLLSEDFLKMLTTETSRLGERCLPASSSSIEKQLQQLGVSPD